MRRENYDEQTNGRNDKYEHASQIQFAPSSACLFVCLSACASDYHPRAAMPAKSLVVNDATYSTIAPVVEKTPVERKVGDVFFARQ